MSDLPDFLRYTAAANPNPHQRQRLRDAAAEIERLRATVSHLPRTADGVPVVPGMRVHSRKTDYWAQVCYHTEPWMKLLQEDAAMTLRFSRVWSTRETASAAGGEA